MKTLSRALLISSFFLSSAVVAETFEIPLTVGDQCLLTHEISHICTKFHSVKGNTKKYTYLGKKEAFYIHCKEGKDKNCSVGFNYEVSHVNHINAHDSTSKDLAIAEINDQNLAADLYKAIGSRGTPEVSFISTETLTLTDPVTGLKTSTPRLRIDCKRDATYSNFSCLVAAVKK
jgi:hypothetical protein